MSGIRIESDNQEIEQIFTWAKRTAAVSLIADGESGPLDVSEANPGPFRHAPYRASYRAGYAHRSGYYLRDFAHQAVGAQLLGWQRHNAAMLSALLATATPEHGGWPVWALNFDGETPLAIDYRGPHEFVRELPAIFELVELVHTLYRWTGDAELLGHRAFWRNTLGAFVEAHDTHRPNGVAEGSGLGIFDGAASYNEHPTARFREAGDAFGAQYAATLHAAALERAGGATEEAERYERTARGLAAYFLHTWSRGEAGAIVNGWTVDGDPVTTWGRETTWFMPLKGLFADDQRAEALLREIDHLCADPVGAPAIIEALTYVPDLYLRHGDADTAWRWMRHIYAIRDDAHEVPQQGLNGSYPEVPFTLVAQIIGLLGLQPNAAGHTVTTRVALPTGMSRLAAFDVPFGDGTIDVGTIDTGTTTGGLWLRNGTSEPIRWQLAAAEPGFQDPHLDRATAPAASVTVAPGERMTLPAG
ncbi:hypothetical protein EV379_3004 [Microterricola gilva]|uniref:Uncharacterized protein n=1 Tax=Microterricola gilva TaxID=393267 RepID=A0A4Q8AQZ0_9MICO|nr:hypothetical protein [Microterricola gilva]RZU66641.1 hypothetical protein EV379_3004 [Microterricola gilva]